MQEYFLCPMNVIIAKERTFQASDKNLQAPLITKRCALNRDLFRRKLWSAIQYIGKDKLITY